MSDQQRYRVIEKLESGGMAEVFRAESEGLQGFKKQVAIKRVLPHLSEKKKFISMFLDEARLSAALSHSNCVQVFDIGVGDNAYFIVMEFVDGANLKSIGESIRKQGREFPVSAAVFICAEICKGLSYAHEMKDANGVPQHIVHRDMSPPNVLVTKYGEVKIVDFGLAKASTQLEKSEPGIIKGKFSYLSPEAAQGQDVDARTDIFAVGIMLWEMLSAQRLFLGETDYQTVRKVQQAVVPPITQINPKVSPELERVIAKALARDQNQRYQTARDLGQDLNRFLFKNGEAIGTFDIATLVQSTMRDRQKIRAPQGSIIDKLIEEALLEFTSLKEDGSHPDADITGNNKQVPAMKTGQFVDPTNWAAEIGIGELRRPTPDPIGIAGGLQEGNLSALEDAPVHAPPPISSGRASGPGSMPGAMHSSMPPPMQSHPPPASLPPPAGPIQGTLKQQPAKKGSGGIVFLLLFLVAAVAAGAAYFKFHGRFPR
jgi:serine/threonine-protein kinase